MKLSNDTNQGIAVNVYRANGFDCTNNGITKNNDRLIMVDGTEEGNFDCPHTTATPEEDYLVFIKDTRAGSERLRAIPKSLLDSGKWTMFGGNFVYSSDSRFPSKAPIKVHDRVEG